MDKDDYDNALRFFERALAIEPTNVDILDAAADACIEAVRVLQSFLFGVSGFILTLLRGTRSARFRCCCGL